MATSSSSEEKIAVLREEIQTIDRRVKENLKQKKRLETKIRQCCQELESCRNEERRKIEIELERNKRWHGKNDVTIKCEQKELAEKKKKLKLLEQNVRPRPKTAVKKFVMCDPQKCRGASCTYAHSDLELRTWNNELTQDQHKEACQKVIDEKRKIPLRVIRMNFLGLPRSGKTTFLKRLIGMIINLLQKQDTINDEPSTGIAERHGPVFVTKMGVIESGNWNVADDADQLTKIVGHLVFQAGQQTSTESGKKSRAYQVESTSTDGPHPPVKQHTKNLDAIYSVYGKAIKDDDWDQMKLLLDDAVLLINTDTGGQTEFLELLSRFLLGSSSLNLIFTKLTCSLDEHYEVYSTDLRGLSTKKEDSMIAVKDVLFQALACVASLKWSDHDEPKALFVGTFKDQVSRERVDEYDKALLDRIKTTDFYQHNIIQYPFQNKVLLPVDNYSGGEEEVHEIRKVLKDIMIKSFEKIEMPVHWLMLNLSIQCQLEPVLGYVNCKRLAEKLKIDENGLLNALKFLHESVGSLFYYPEISDFFKKNIIRDTQVFFDAATKLIRRTFVFETVNQPVIDRFTEKAQFSEEDLNKAIKNEAHEESPIPMEEFIKLLKYHNIIAEIPSSRQTEKLYFMPCKLESAKPTELSEASCSEAAPLIVKYDCGFVPLGIFCSLVIGLISKDWKLRDDRMYRNKIQFEVKEHCSIVTLIGHPDYLEIVLTVQRDDTNKICSIIHQTIEETLTNVASSQNYYSTTNFKFGFKCLCDADSDEGHVDHFCVIENKKYSRCIRHNKIVQVQQLQKNQQVWIETEVTAQENPVSFSLGNLTLLKTTHNGNEYSLRILRCVCNSWKEIADLIGILPSLVTAIETKRHNDPVECCRDVFGEWLKVGQGEGKYEANWEGLYVLLCDIEQEMLARDLKDALGLK